jgi:bicarbonate transport system substrate-binding protein
VVVAGVDALEVLSRPVALRRCAKALNDQVTRENLWKQAAKELGVPAKELGVPAKDIPKGSSRGVEPLSVGVVYDTTKPHAYLDNLKIKR